MAQSAVGVNADTGRLLWKVDHITPFDENIPSPIFHNGHVFITSRSTGARLLMVKEDGSVEPVWSTRELDNQHGGVVLLEDFCF